ncbi:MAG: hypothetical protein MI725_01295 [Pirellulales bacterium]|nr:hypothetical protein [Pirellulales bacterium]
MVQSDKSQLILPVKRTAEYNLLVFDAFAGGPIMTLKRYLARRGGGFLLICITVMGVAATAIHSWAEQQSGSPADEKPKAPGARMSLPPAAVIAQEIVKLQEQMGGSIVHDRPVLQGWDSPSAPVDSKSVPQDVEALRGAAWQLDTMAHELEQLDLYPQADALRELAGRFRLDARALKKAAQIP